MITIFVVLFYTFIQVNLFKVILVFQTMHFIKVFQTTMLFFSLLCLYSLLSTSITAASAGQSWTASTLCFDFARWPKKKSLSVVLKCHFRVPDPLTTKFMIKAGYLISHVQFNWTNTWYIVIFGLEGKLKCNMACASSFPGSPVLKMLRKMSMGSKQWQIFYLFNLF